MAIQDHINQLKKNQILCHSNMEKSIQMAKSVLANMFGIDISHFDKHTTRSANVIEARRFLIYYLIHECGIRHLHMNIYIPALTNHATSIHHYNKMKSLMEVEKSTKETYQNFKNKMEKDGHSLLMKDYTQAIQDFKVIEERLQTLKNLL